MPDSRKAPQLSILVPAYNESKNIGNTLRAVSRYLDRRRFDYEIIVVDDGSSDNTALLARKGSSERIKIVRYQTNMGKGFAIRTAFDNSRGQRIAFFDAGLDYQPEHIERFLETMSRTGADIVIGSKRHPESQVNYPWKRVLISNLGRLVTKTLFNLSVTDTQVGMKLFKREILSDILPRALVKKFAYDIELLAMAQRYGYKIVEAPVKLNFNFKNSSVNWKTVLNTGQDTLAIFYRLKILKFYDLPEAEREKAIKKMRQKYQS